MGYLTQLLTLLNKSIRQVIASVRGSSNADAELHEETDRDWCAVANIVAVRKGGPEGTEIRNGTKHFAPNAKVYVVDYFWGMGGENVTVIGHHRKSRRLITIVIASKFLVRWRVAAIYNPAIARRIAKKPSCNGVSRDKAKIQRLVDGWNAIARDSTQDSP